MHYRSAVQRLFPVYMSAIALALVGLAGMQSCAPQPPDAAAPDAAAAADTFAANRPAFTALRAGVLPIIDGKPADACWQNAPWLPLSERWLGEPYTDADFQGRYKLSWSDSFLYVLAEITDDTLIDIHPDGLDRYWDDDCLEIFVDENRSGGNHQYNHNAFAYHIALDGRAVDVGRDSAFRYYDHHIRSARQCAANTCIWEVAVRLYPDTYLDDQPQAVAPLLLNPGKIMGFALAYCDNDRSPERENFIGNAPVPGEDKNRGWIDAGIFGQLELKNP